MEGTVGRALGLTRAERFTRGYVVGYIEVLGLLGPTKDDLTLYIFT